MIKKTLLLLLLFNSIISILHAQVPEINTTEEVQQESPPINYDRNFHYAKPPRPQGKSTSTGSYLENQKFGLKINDSIVTKAIYDRIIFNTPYGFIVKQGKKYGYISPKGEAIIAVKYDSIGVLGSRSPFLLVKKRNAFGIINHKGEKILSIKHPKILGANNANLCAVEDKAGNFYLYQNNKKVFKHHLDRIAFYDNGAIIGQHGKYGFISNTTKTKIEYDTLTTNGFWNRSRNYTKNTFPPFYSFGSKQLDRLVVEKEGKFGMIDLSGNVIIPIENDEIYHEPRQNFFYITKGKKRGTYLTQCNKFIPAEYDKVSMDKGDIILTKDKKVGIINKQTGDVIIPIEYTSAKSLNRSYSDAPRGFYIVKNGETTGLISNQKVIIPIEFDYIYPFEKMFVVVKEDLRGLYSQTGEIIQPLIYNSILSPRTDENAVIFTKKDDQYGMLTMEGNTLYKNVFKQRFSIADSEQNLNLLKRKATAFYQGLQHENGKYGVIDVFTGQLNLPLEYDGIHQKIIDDIKNETYFLVSKDGKYGLVDEKNEVVIHLKYDRLDISLNRHLKNADDLKNTFFVVQQNGKYGVINLSDEVIIPLQKEEITKISATTGLFKVKKGDVYILINHKNEILNETRFDEIANFELRRTSNATNERKRIALTFTDGKMREIDENGTFLTQPISMQPHEGFQSIIDIKTALIDALNSPNDSALYYFAEKITPSDHLMYFFKDSDLRIKNQTQYLHYESITARYYKKLLEFKYYEWKNGNFELSNIQTEDYTVKENGLVTNRRISNWAYGDTRILEKILRHAIKINGYWISGYFLKGSF